MRKYSLKQLWTVLGFSQFTLIVIPSLIYKLKTLDSRLDYDQTLLLVYSLIFAVILGIWGHKVYQKALVQSDYYKKQTLYIISWILAETITIIGSIGIMVFWTDILNSMSLWFSAIILWIIWRPKE